MLNIILYKKWAPEESCWSLWVKPTLFIDIAPHVAYGTTMPIHWLEKFRNDTLAIVDLPGEESILEGLSLCQEGFRPVPLYNGVNPRGEYAPVIPVTEIVNKLAWGAEIITKRNLMPDAPPVFLLDSRRLTQTGTLIGMYDNRWCLFPQDMPSADFIQKQGIQRVIVRSDTIRNDLVHILKRYQDAGLMISICDHPERQIRNITVDKPSLFKSLAYRAATVKGLQQNSGGGFGGLIPLPSSGGHMG